MNYLYQLLVGLFSGCFAAWITTFFALRRFYSEKWWEKRATALIELTDAVYQLKLLQEYNYDLRDYHRGPPEDSPDFVELSKDQLDEMELAAAKARKLIAKYSQVGPLLITDKLSKILIGYVNEGKKVDFDVHYKGWDYEEANEHLLMMTKKLLNDLLQASREELKAK